MQVTLPNYKALPRAKATVGTHLLEVEGADPVELTIQHLDLLRRTSAEDKAPQKIAQYINGKWIGEDGSFREDPQPFLHHGEPIELSEFVIEQACYLEIATLNPKIDVETWITISCVDPHAFLAASAAMWELTDKEKKANQGKKKDSPTKT